VDHPPADQATDLVGDQIIACIDSGNPWHHQRSLRINLADLGMRVR
jgi:hypothetical protein